MKKIFNILIILFPYLFLILLYSFLKDIYFGNGFWLIYLFLIFILFGINLAVYIFNLIFMILKWNIKKSILSILIIKVAYLPVYCVLFLIFILLLNPLSLVFVPLLLILSFIFMIITGIMSTVMLVKLYMDKKIKLSITILCSILSYCYILDVILFIILYIRLKDVYKVK